MGDKIKKLNLGCGKDIRKGYINLDSIKLPGVDRVHNLDKFPYPFKNNYFDEILCSHVIEHVDNLMRVMEEIHRISKPNALIKIKAPYFSGQGAFNDPTHKHFFTYFTFNYFDDKYYYSKIKFKTIKKKIYWLSAPKFMRINKSWFIDWFINLIPIIYQRLFCWLFPASEIHYLLKVIK